jgi:single-stranded DNA-binding protein
MPTQASCTVIGHAYEPAKKVGTGERTGASFRFYTTDRVKNISSGEYEKEFTSHSAIVWGKEAEWLIRDCKKGSMVVVSGTFRVRKWEKDGKAGAGTDIQAQSAKVLDAERAEGDADVAPVAAPRRPAPVVAAGDDEPPF